MVFSSLNFLLVFLPIVMLLYAVLPLMGKNIVLLIASIIFYAWGEPVYVILMLLNIAFNYMAGLILEEMEDGRSRNMQLVFAVAVNLLLLGFFKYAGFLVSILNGILGHGAAAAGGAAGPITWKALALPVGISFYTFQALSYVIDVYRRKVAAQRNPINFALYITMFPQLVAGPIVKYTEIEEQLGDRRLSSLRFGKGVERLIFGLSKKVLLANNLGLLHTTIQAASSRSLMTAWLGSIAYTLQIYFDFSGYSDMAIGMGQMLGFDFPENFNFPYTAQSITDFWRRWHMTLSGWFREYVYIPLGGNRCSVPRHITNLLIVWMLTGMWHGAGWNFILWGVYYGILLILEKYLLAGFLDELPMAARRVYTLFLVNIGWVLFSNTEFAGMKAYLANMIGIGASGLVDGAFFYYLRNNLLLFIIAFIGATPAIRTYLVNGSSRRPVRYALLMMILFLLSIAFLVYGTYNPFLYFRF